MNLKCYFKTLAHQYDFYINITDYTVGTRNFYYIIGH